MAVFRVERTHNYTIMSNHHLRDKNLSLKAKGLLSQMLSLPENWDYTLSGLALINAEGKDAIRAAVKELEKAGYVQRRQTTDKDGKFSVNEYIIRECPVSQEQAVEGPSSANPLSENPTAAFSSTDSTLSEKPTQLNIDIQSKENKKTDSRNTESFSSLPSAPPMESHTTEEAVSLEAKGKKRTKRSHVSKTEMDAYRGMIRENIRYDEFTQERPWDTRQADELVELMTEAVCSKKEVIRVAGEDFPQTVVKSRLLKLDGEHIRFVLDCLQENTTQIRNMKQYLLTVLFNAPATMENHYASKISHDFYSAP